MGGGAIADYQYGLAKCPEDPETHAVVCDPQIAYKDFGTWILPLLLYTMWGACDALVQCWSYWILGQLSERPEILSRYSGWYKTWNSLGNAVGAFLVAALKYHKDAQLWINIGLFAAALPPAAYVCSTIQGGKSVSSAAQPLSDA